MSKMDVIGIHCFNQEIGRIGFDEDKNSSFFQYHSDFLNSNIYSNLFPLTGIIERNSEVQLFTKFNNETFRGLPPMIADSLPDLFGNLIFTKWLESKEVGLDKISVIEQLAYVSERGMGALEFKPSKVVPSGNSFDLEEVIEVLKQVLDNKIETQSFNLSHQSLLTIFKIGSSAGGARPKILISEHKETKEIIPGDLTSSGDYNHYLVKLSLGSELGFPREITEFCYYLTATKLGIRMMPSKLIDNIHFATLRFDRVDGQKKHMLTASGLTGWDFMDPQVSTYENLFELALFLKIPHCEVEELFRRMVFNVVFCNTDDHLKNHTFIYDEMNDSWNLSPAYDLTYSLNPMLNYKRVSRALSINGKRVDVKLVDILKVAKSVSIKQPQKIISEIQNGIEYWMEQALNLNLPKNIIGSIHSDFKLLA